MPWIYNQTYDEYYDFDKELYRIPDSLRTSVDLHLTFNVETRTCHWRLTSVDDSGDVRTCSTARYIDWSVGLDMLRAEDFNIPEELQRAFEDTVSDEARSYGPRK